MVQRISEHFYKNKAHNEDDDGVVKEDDHDY